MIRYAIIEDEVTKRVSYEVGTDVEFYTSIGMTEMEIEQSDIDGLWYVAGYAPMKSEEQKQLEEQQRLLNNAKAQRAEKVNSIIVEVDGMVFDGDEKAQERMARAVIMANSLDEETVWVLHDNTVATVTAGQLKRACREAGKKQTEFWTVPYV
jgi:hypothetical protein